MQINKLLTAICCLVVALWADAQCAEKTKEQGENDNPIKNHQKEKIDKDKIYHSRESYETEIQSFPGRGGSIMGYIGPKIRDGGLGPEGTIEISPWVKSVKWITSMREGDELELIFDPAIHSAYVGVNTHKVIGHCCIRNIASIKNPYGGNIKKTKSGSIFRTNELSGHFGAQWNDNIRFKFIELMFLKGIKILHEPWVRDSVVLEKSKELYDKKVSVEKISFTDDDYQELGKISEANIFSKFTDEQLSIYQDNFLRKFGNSIFNPCFTPGMCISPWSSPPSPILYEQVNEDPLFFKLKDEFRDKGKLDLKFYKDGIFSDQGALEGYLFKYFEKKI